MDRIISDTRFAFVIGVAVVATAAVYVAFGPPSLENTLRAKKNQRKKGKRRHFSGEPKGLHNAGNTCFVNAILQATAACPALILWLEEKTKNLSYQRKPSKDSNIGSDQSIAKPNFDVNNSILKLALLRVLRVANGSLSFSDDENCEKEELDPEIWAPAALFRALRAHRWVINTDEQDAHEFFQVLLSTVEEELQKEPKIGPTPLFDTADIETSIVDLINNDNEDINLDDKVPEPCQSHQTESVEADSDTEGQSNISDGEILRTGSRCSRQHSRRHRRKTTSRSSSGVFVRSGQELSMENVLKQTRLPASSTPFTGTITNKLSFRGTGKCKSPTSSTMFNNITLSLPISNSEGVSNTYSWVSGVTAAPVTLETLLQMFVSVEAVSSVSSSNNTESATDNSSLASTKNSNDNNMDSNKNHSRDLVKQLTFARLPECICFHIQRTAFEKGIPRKRNDPVLFPAILNMDNYVYNRQISKKKMLEKLSTNASSKNLNEEVTPDNYCTQTPVSLETPSCASSNWFLSPGDEDNSLMISSISSTMSDICNYSTNNSYNLRAVVVHIGAIDSGHYVTYRREADISNSSNDSVKQRWFYTSDSVVREVTLDEVLNTNPYMLFYERNNLDDLS